MNSFYSLKFLKAVLGVAFVGIALTPLSPSAGAQTFQQATPHPQVSSPPPMPPVTLEQARAYMRLVLTYKALQSPLTLSVKNASLEKIADQVQKSLAENQSTSKVEIRVRQAHPVRLSFTAKDSTVDGILRSSGDLASVQLWVFSDYLLLAPSEALSPDEKKALEAGNAFKAPTSAGDRSGLLEPQQRFFSAFVAQEIKGLNTGKGTNKTTFTQLSPESQQMLQVLFANTKESLLQNASERSRSNPTMSTLTINAISGLTVSNSDSVELSTTDRSAVQLQFFGKGVEVKMAWSTSGGTTASIGVSPGSGSPGRPPSLLLDPSAGDS